MFIVCSRYGHWIVYTHTDTSQPHYPLAPKKISLTWIIHTRHLPGHSSWMFQGIWQYETLRIAIWMASLLAHAQKITWAKATDSAAFPSRHRCPLSRTKQLGPSHPSYLPVMHFYIRVCVWASCKVTEDAQAPPSESTKCKNESAGRNVSMIPRAQGHVTTPNLCQHGNATKAITSTPTTLWIAWEKLMGHESPKKCPPGRSLGTGETSSCPVYRQVRKPPQRPQFQLLQHGTTSVIQRVWEVLMKTFSTNKQLSPVDAMATPSRSRPSCQRPKDPKILNGKGPLASTQRQLMSWWLLGPQKANMLTESVLKYNDSPSFHYQYKTTFHSG